MTDRVRVAVIGAGWWGTTAHLPALRKHPRAELVAVQKTDPAKARQVARDFGAAQACTTVDEVLGIPGLDAVVISSTPNVHYAQAKAALERGLHVLIEKPMTITAAQAQELVDLARRRGLHMVISCPWHYTPHGIEARRLVQSGALGQLKMISTLMTNFTLGLYEGRPWAQIFGDNPTLQNSAQPYLAPRQNSYSDPSIAGGGQIYCQVSHAAAYVGFLTGGRPAEVFARFDNAGTQVDIYDALNIKLDDGTLVSLASHGATMLSERNYEVRVYGTGGMILLELWKGKMEFHNKACQVTRYDEVPADDIYPMFAPANNFIDTIAGTAANGSPGDLGVFAMRVTEAAVESARTGRNVVLPESKVQSSEFGVQS